MAEAYLKSLDLPAVIVSSSGIEASENNMGPITWYAMRIIFNNLLHHFAKPMWEQTTKELLQNADQVIFMTEYHHEFAKSHLDFTSTNYQIWYIEDVPVVHNVLPKEEIDLMHITEATYLRIKEKVDTLAKEITQ
jgi:protein-tyrosine-phosphatase